MIRNRIIGKKRWLVIAGLFLMSTIATADDALWNLAKKNAPTLRFSTLFTAQNVRQFLSSDEGIGKAVQWCKETAVTHVYLETFRGGYTVDRDVMLNAKKQFLDAGFLVSGCVTTTKIGRDSVNGWIFPCFTDPAALEKLKTVFEFSAGLFDEVMVDDFFATRCECEHCIEARGDKSWDEFRCDLLVDVSKKYVIDPARAVNPDVVLIIKYPQWYDDFHNKGYEVVRQTAMFDKTWVGTETREPDSKQWGRKAQYEAYFLMRWLGEIGGTKCGGGWFDPYGTTPPTYLEQARQTILGGAREALLFCYGSLQNDTGPENVRALRREIPQLFQLAQLIQGKKPRGISAPKLPNSDGGKERYVYDFVGMLGLPLVPLVEIDRDDPAVFLSVHSMKDPQLTAKLSHLIEQGSSVLVTDELANKLPPALKNRLKANQRLKTPDDLWALMDLPRERLRDIRKNMLKPLGLTFDAPSRVALYLFDKDIAVIENFNNEKAVVSLNVESGSKISTVMTIPLQKKVLSAKPKDVSLELPPRSLVVLRF